MWKAPHRPKNEITQSYNDGLVTVYRLSDTAQPGYQPVVTLSEVTTLRYAEQRLGIQRYYSGMQNQIRVERVLRVPDNGLVSTQDVAETEDGKRYRIDLVQAAEGVFPRSVDLTLVSYGQGVSESGTEGGGST